MKDILLLILLVYGVGALQNLTEIIRRKPPAETEVQGFPPAPSKRRGGATFRMNSELGQQCNSNMNPGFVLASALTFRFIMHVCPRLSKAEFVEPCPRKDWKTRSEKEYAHTGQESDSVVHHYKYNDLKTDTIYDMQPTFKKDIPSSLVRARTCKIAEPINRILVESYGLGWVYLRWATPKENCKVKYFRFGSDKFPDNQGDWAYQQFTIDDKKTAINFCPPTSFFTSFLFFLILLILLLLLLLVAVVLGAILYKKRKNNRKMEDMEKDGIVEEEPIPPTSGLEKAWERLKNFFKELCPSPKPPPPPPPTPPPKPKPKKPKPKPKPVLKPKPKPTPISKPEPKPEPEPEPEPESESESESEPEPPPPPPSPVEKPKHEPKPDPDPEPEPVPPPKRRPKTKKKRKPRGSSKKRRDAANIDTKRAESGVGGVRRR